MNIIQYLQCLENIRHIYKKGFNFKPFIARIISELNNATSQRKCVRAPELAKIWKAGFRNNDEETNRGGSDRRFWKESVGFFELALSILAFTVCRSANQSSEKQNDAIPI